MISAFSGNVDHVLCAANHIQLVPVIEACVDFLQSHIMLINCLDVLNTAELFTLDHLKTFVYKYISKNFLEFGMSKEFLRLTTSQLETLLDLNYPVNCTECEVLSVLIGWIVHHYGFNPTGASNILTKLQFTNLNWSDIENIPNFRDLEKLIECNKTDVVLQGFRDQVLNEPSKSVPGLINLRGYEETVVICGGFRPGQGMTNSVQCYNKSNGILKTLTCVPHIEQCNFGTSVINNKLYVVGGCYNDDQMEEFVHGFGFCFDPTRNAWQNIAPMNTERCRFYLGAVGNKLYAIGGDPAASMETGEFAQCECYDLETRRWQRIAALPGNRMEHAGTRVGDNLYISGGLQDPEGPVFNSFWKYETSTDMWVELPPLLTPRADHGMFTYEGRIYVIGGWYEDDLTHQRVMANTVDCFDLEKGQWEVIGQVESPRLYATYNVHEGQVVVIGGWLNGDCQRKCNTVDVFDLHSLTWSQGHGGHASQEVWEHTSCTMYLPTGLYWN